MIVYPTPATSLLLVLAALGTLICAAAFARKAFQTGGEASRKTIHIGMACIALLFPWMFDSSGPVFILAALALVGLLALRLVPALDKAVRGIDRESLGEFYFPIGVAIAFHITEADPVLYCPPILMLGFGDGFAALIGKQFGPFHYTTHEGTKTLEGSIAFFSAAFTTTFACLAIVSDASFGQILFVSTLFSSIGLILEAIAWKGLDNLFIPVAGAMTMSAYAGQSPADLALRTVMLVLFAAMAFAFKRRSTFNDSGLLGVALLLYLVWALQHWSWMLSPLVVFLLFPLLVRFDYLGYQNFQSIPSLFFINLVSFSWLAVSIDFETSQDAFWLFSAGYAFHLAMIWVKRAHSLQATSLSPWLLLGFPAISIAATQCLPVLFNPAVRFDASTWLISLVSLGIAVVCSVVVSRTRLFDHVVGMSLREWQFRSSLSGGGTLALYGLFFFEAL